MLRLVNKQAGKEDSLRIGADETQIKRNVLHHPEGNKAVAIARALVSEAPVILKMSRQET